MTFVDKISGNLYSELLKTTLKMSKSALKGEGGGGYMGHKHILEMAYSKHCLENMHTTKSDATQTTAVFVKQSCTYLLKILPLTPTAAFFASPTVSSTIFLSSSLGPMAV